ncbi:MAG: DUF898 domain-containing protein [Bryobacterales bacterium]|nr:DUF898 domain-containing protein [Bryobacterales bacterium]
MSETDQLCKACGQPAPPQEAFNEDRPPSAAGQTIFSQGRIYPFAFYGETGPLTGLYLKTFLLSLATLGIYSFWGRAAIRRYLYAHMELDGHRFAFHGTGRELAMGALKMAGVILAMVVQSLLWYLLFEESLASVAGSLVFYAAAVLLTPFALVGSWRYRLSRTSYRGIRFGFTGTVGELFPSYLKWIAFTILSLGIYTPVMGAHLRRYFCEHARYGNAPFAFDGDGAELIGPLIGSGLLAPFTLGLSLFWYRVRKFRFYWTHTTFQGARVRTDVSTSEMLWLSVVNAVATLLTLGLAAGWAHVRYLEYVSRHVTLDGVINLDHVVQSAQSASAAGETLSDFLDVDGVDLGL